jgi:hypothetical protein
MALLKGLQGLFMVLDCILELLDVFRPPLPKSSLSLAVALFSLF